MDGSGEWIKEEEKQEPLWKRMPNLNDLARVRSHSACWDVYSSRGSHLNTLAGQNAV